MAISRVPLRRVPAGNRTPRIYQREPGAAIWYADIWIAGRRTRRSLGACETRSDAREKANQLQAEARESGVVQGHSFHRALGAWLDADTRKATDASVLNRLMAEYSDRRIEEVTQDNLAQAFPGIKAANWNRYISTIKAALRRYAESHKTPVPVLKKRKVAQPPPRYLQPEEWLRLRAALPEILVAPADLAITTGLRKANVFGLTWSQVSFTGRTVTIPATSSKSGLLLHLPLSDDALAVLKRQQGRHPHYVFPDGDGHLQLRRKAWEGARKAAKVPAVNWHSLRHTWASWHVLAGTPLRVLKDLGGWQSIEMVEVYSYLLPSALQGFAGNVKLPQPKRARAA